MQGGEGRAAEGRELDKLETLHSLLYCSVIGYYKLYHFPQASEFYHNCRKLNCFYHFPKFLHPSHHYSPVWGGRHLCVLGRKRNPVGMSPHLSPLSDPSYLNCQDPHHEVLGRPLRTDHYHSFPLQLHCLCCLCSWLLGVLLVSVPLPCPPYLCPPWPCPPSCAGCRSPGGRSWG